MSPDLDYLAHLAHDSDRFAEVLLGADPMRPVPSCPDWTTVDLFWHLTEVQWFWGTVVRERAEDPEQLRSAPPERPTDLQSLGHVFATVSAGLEEALEAPPETPVWTWSDDRSVGFVRRRQAHEALIHRVDAELATGERSPIDSALAADGVDEALRVMHGHLPAWASFEPDGATVLIETDDTADTWTVALGRVTGTDPESGESHDETGLRVDDGGAGGAPVATVRGPAADLDCWLWNRLAADRVGRSGDDAALGRLQSVIARGID